MLPSIVTALLTTLPMAETFPYPVATHRLDNGLTVVFIPMPSEGLVAYWSIVRTGSRDEVEPGVTGFAHFFEHVMFRGTEKYPGPEYDRIVNGMGADANAYTTDDYTAYHLGFARDDLPTVIEIESDRFQNLKYDEAQFKTESGAVYGEYRKGRTNPYEVLFEALQDTAFDVHTYKHTTIGFEADVAAMPQQYEYSKGFFQRFYRPENVVVVVAGDFPQEETLALIRRHYSGWTPGYQAPAVPLEPPQAAQRRVDVAFDGETLPILAVAFKGERLMPGDKTQLAGTLLGELAFGETSPLYKKLVLQEQRLDALYVDFGYNRDPGLWAVLAVVKDPGDVAAVEAEIFATVAALGSEPVGQQRLDDARSRTKYGFLSSLSTPTSVCERLARLVALTGGVEVVDQLFATLEKVTPEDLRGAARRWCLPQASTVAVLTTREPEGGTLAQAPVLLPVPQDPNVAVKVWFAAGSQDDPPGKEGLAALTGALLSEGGSRSLTYDQMLEKMYPLAASIGLGVDKEMTVASGLVHRDHVDEFMDLFVDALARPGLRQADFVRLRDRAITAVEKSLRYSSDEELGKAALSEAVFAGTPYEHLDLGTVASLSALTLADVEAFWSAHYTRDTAVLALGGAYAEDLPGRLTAALGALPAGTPEAAPLSVAQRPQGRHVRIVKKPGASTAISFGTPIDVHRGSREFYALWLANSWLGEHRNSNSHLYQVIREARGMNYGDYSYIEAYPNGGQLSMPPTGVGRRSQMFEVWVRPVLEERALFALRAALREVDLFVQNGLTQEQFEATRGFLRKYCLHFAETTEDRLGYALDDRYFGLSESHLATFRRTMDELTLDEVNAAIRKHLQTKDLIIALVTENAEQMAAAIAADTPSPMDYGDVPKPQEILDEDKLIQAWPLAVPEQNIRIVPVDSMFASGPPPRAQR